MPDPSPTRSYPIRLSPRVPVALERLLRDYGVPVTRESVSAIVVKDRQESSESQVALDWQDLLPEGASLAAIDREAVRCEQCTWTERGVPMTEAIVREPIGDAVIERLKHRILLAGRLWVRLAPWPAGFDGVFNFRVDVDEPAPDDWRRVVAAIDRAGIEPGVTWFVSTRAAETSPEIASLLEGRDVHSHGHWHHVHANDAALNAVNLAEADQRLRSFGFRPDGFAAPCGRLTTDLLDHLSGLNYRFLAGLGGLCGSVPRSHASGIRSIHALPVSEGAFLEAGLDDVATIVGGYRDAAERAVSRDRPVFWYGHPERRLGRRPEILDRLFASLPAYGKLWRVGLSAYADWLDDRDGVEISVDRLISDESGSFVVRWSHARDTGLPAMIWVEDGRRRWAVPCAGVQGRFDLNLLAYPSSLLPVPLPEPCSVRFFADSGWKNWLRTKLDWERETPSEWLTGGPSTRRLKGVLRRLTDPSWQSRFRPKAWSMPDDTMERPA